MKTKTKKTCSRCIYDSTMPNISFDKEGICNYCRQIEQMEKEYPTGKEGEKKLKALAQEIKKGGKGKKYDCVVGVSGGCDSSYLLYRMKMLNLRPLAVHFDNTWDSAISTINLSKVLKRLKVDLFTIVVDNKEYDDIYRSFMKAGVADIEAPTDIGLATTLYYAAEKYGLKYIIEGHSFRTEGISPLGWLYMDGKFISSIHKRFGTLPMKTYPNLWFRKFMHWIVVKRIKKIRPLYYIDYDKEKVKKFLKKEFEWQWYGGHHLENRFTSFYHSYFLPTRFGIDGRLLGYAAMVRSGQMTRNKALELMISKPVCDEKIIDLVRTRLGLSKKEFEKMMSLPHKTYKNYETYKPLFELLRPLFYLLYKFDLVPKSFYMKFTSKHNA